MKIIILSGVSGSGKSTYISKLKGTEVPFKDVKVCSADNFFIKDGEYKFDPTKLGEAHAECLKEYANTIVGHEHCHDSHLPDILCVDNTNLSNEELAPYVSLGTAYGYEVELVTLLVDPAVASARNLHGVSLKSCQNMDYRLRNRKLPPFWNIKKTIIG